MARTNPSKITVSPNCDNTRDVLTHALQMSVGKVVRLIDGETPDGLVTGMDLPSTKDMGLRIYLGQVIQTIHSQLYGYTTTSGKNYAGALSYLTEAEYRVNSPGFILRAEQDTLSAADMKAFHYLELAEARVNMMTEHLQAMKEVYKNVTREDWKPYNAEAPATAVTKATKEDIKAKLAAMRGKQTQLPV